jgi:hypothetical protein
VNGLVLVDEGVSTLLSGLPNGVSKSLDFRLVDFRLVGDIAAPEIGLGHLVGVYLVAMEVAFPDGIYKIDFDVKHLADSVSLVLSEAGATAPETAEADETVPASAAPGA